MIVQSRCAEMGTKEEGGRVPKKYFIENMHYNSVLQFLMGVKGSG